MLSRLSSLPLSLTMSLLLHKLYFAFDSTNDLTANQLRPEYIPGGGNLPSKMQRMHILSFQDKVACTCAEAKIFQFDEDEQNFIFLWHCLQAWMGVQTKVEKGLFNSFVQSKPVWDRSGH